jgi:hypothetical protein
MPSQQTTGLGRTLSQQTTGLASTFFGVVRFMVRGFRRVERPLPLIERATERVTQRLSEVMRGLISYGQKEAETLEVVARSIGVEVSLPPLTEAQNRGIDHAVWRPVAQLYVHRLLPPILEPAMESAVDMTSSQALQIWAPLLMDLARSASLSIQDARLAATVTGQVFFESDLFDSEETVLVGDSQFWVRRTGANVLRIERVVIAQGATTAYATTPEGQVAAAAGTA